MGIVQSDLPIPCFHHREALPRPPVREAVALHLACDAQAVASNFEEPPAMRAVQSNDGARLHWKALRPADVLYGEIPECGDGLELASARHERNA